MFVAGLLFFVVIFGTLIHRKKAPPKALVMPVSETMNDASTSPKILDRLWLWVGVTLALIVLAYGPVFLTHTYQFNSSGFPGLTGGSP